jgi:hypothetical protein
LDQGDVIGNYVISVDARAKGTAAFVVISSRPPAHVIDHDLEWYWYASIDHHIPPVSL